MNGGLTLYACRRLWYVKQIIDSSRRSDGGLQEHEQVLKPQADQACLLLARNEGQFELISVWTGRHIAAARLAVRADGSQLIVASAYGPRVAQRRGELGEDISQLCLLFIEVPILIGGDLNVTITPEDRPYGGCDPGSAQFRDVLNQCGHQEMGPTDRRYTQRGPTTQSRLDRFLCSIELMGSFPLALVTALPRPLSDHSPSCGIQMLRQ